jgi:hypothetical protein
MPFWNRIAPSCAAVVKLQACWAAIALPAASVAPVVTVTVYGVECARSVAGFSVKVVLPPDGVIVALTAGPPAVGASVKVDALSVAGSIASENVATALVPVATSPAPSAGSRVVRVGVVVSGARAVVNDQVCCVTRALPAASLAPVVTVAV